MPVLGGTFFENRKSVVRTVVPINAVFTVDQEAMESDRPPVLHIHRCRHLDIHGHYSDQKTNGKWFDLRQAAGHSGSSHIAYPFCRIIIKYSLSQREIPSRESLTVDENRKGEKLTGRSMHKSSEYIK